MAIQWDQEQLQREVLPPAKGKGVVESLTPLEEKSSSPPLPWAARAGDEKPAVSLSQSYLPFAHRQAEVKCHVLTLAIICSVLLTPI